MSQLRLMIWIVNLGLAVAVCRLANANGDEKQPSLPGPAVTAIPIQLDVEAGTLYGVVDLPPGAGPFPVLVFVAGSGPTDRDGNQPRMKNDSLRLLGQGLATHGIAVLRFDRRGIGQSRKTAPTEENLTIDMLADDVVAWVKLLRKDKRFSQVGIVGHSEGALVGALAARRAPADAFVSLAGVGRKMHMVLREQLAKNLSENLKERSDAIIDELVAGRTVADPPKELASLFRPSVQPFLISKFKYDPAKELARLEIPVLIVQGTTDVQTMVEDAKVLAAAKKDAKLVIIEGMNHVLKKASSQMETFKAYYDPSVPLEPRVIEETATFLRQAFAKP
ncbi:MAG TPA: alpha/beta fold hydrolase, partial [Gemmataceae bacterium]|nr:alpha/beta fold hydrolase [Gemmataceae bacterium]